MPASLLLWDIDGTLVHMDRAGEKAIRQAILDLYQRDVGDKLPVDLRGRTDSSIHRDLLHWLKVDTSVEEEMRLRAAHMAWLPKKLPLGNPIIFPGIREILAAVHEHPEIHQGLLTGNVREGAQTKLSHMGLWDYFEFGSFANDSYVRDDLGPIAVTRAEELLKIQFPKDRIFVIGDTPHDVACGKALGAKTVAVATGAFSLETLQALQPDYAFANLQDTQALLRIFL